MGGRRNDEQFYGLSEAINGRDNSGIELNRWFIQEIDKLFKSIKTRFLEVKEELMRHFYGKKLTDRKGKRLVLITPPRNDLKKEVTRFLSELEWELWRLEVDIINLRDMQWAVWHHIRSAEVRNPLRKKKEKASGGFFS